MQKIGHPLQRMTGPKDDGRVAHVNVQTKLGHEGRTRLLSRVIQNPEGSVGARANNNKLPSL